MHGENTLHRPNGQSASKLAVILLFNAILPEVILSKISTERDIRVPQVCQKTHLKSIKIVVLFVFKFVDKLHLGGTRPFTLN